MNTHRAFTFLVYRTAPPFVRVNRLEILDDVSDVVGPCGNNELLDSPDPAKSNSTAIDFPRDAADVQGRAPLVHMCACVSAKYFR